MLMIEDFKEQEDYSNAEKERLLKALTISLM